MCSLTTSPEQGLIAIIIPHVEKLRLQEIKHIAQAAPEA